MMDEMKVFPCAWPHKNAGHFMVFYLRVQGAKCQITMHPALTKPLPNSYLREFIDTHREMGLSLGVDLNRPGVYFFSPPSVSEVESAQYFAMLCGMLGEGPEPEAHD